MPQNWSVLHSRFASSIRDAVSSPFLDGAELLVSDRDAYLMFAYTKYIRLLTLYNPDAVGNILAELFQTATLPAASGIITLPADYNFYIEIGAVEDGVVVTIPPPGEFVRIKTNVTFQAPPSPSNIYLSVRRTTIEVLPDSYAGQFIIGYIIKPLNIQNAAPESTDDIAIQSEHWDTIIAFAKAEYWKDKSEFQIAQTIENEALLNSPFKLGPANATGN